MEIEFSSDRSGRDGSGGSREKVDQRRWTPYHEEVGEEDPERVLLGEDELEHEADDGELEEGARGGVEHLALQPQALREAERDGHGHHGRRRHRLQHAQQEVAPEPRRARVNLLRHQVQERHARVPLHHRPARTEQLLC